MVGPFLMMGLGERLLLSASRYGANVYGIRFLQDLALNQKMAHTYKKPEGS